MSIPNSNLFKTSSIKTDYLKTDNYPDEYYSRFHSISPKKNYIDKSSNRLPNINVILPSPIHKQNTPKFTLPEFKTIFTKTPLLTPLLTETLNCPKYYLTKQQENSPTSSQSKLISYKHTLITKTPLVPVKIKEDSMLKKPINKFNSLFTSKSTQPKDIQTITLESDLQRMISKHDYNKSDFLPSKRDFNRQLIDDVITKVKTISGKNIHIDHTEKRRRKVEIKKTDYHHGSYYYLGSKSPKTQFVCSVSFPLLLKDDEYLNNLSKENNMRFKLNLN